MKVVDWNDRLTLTLAFALQLLLLLVVNFQKGINSIELITWK